MMTTPASMLSSPQAEELSRLVARIRALAPSLPAGLLREAGTCVLSLAEGMEGLAQDSPVLPLRLAFTDQQAEPTEVGDAGSVGSLEGEEHLADEPGDDAAEAAERPRETATLFAPALIGGTEYEVPLEEVPPEDNYGLPLPGLYGSGADGLDFGLPGVVAAAPATGPAQAEEPEEEGAQEEETDGARMSLSGWRGARDSLGLGRSGARVTCDACDLGAGEDNCLAHAMTVPGCRVQRCVDKQARLLAAKPWADRDRREARHACYKSVISWQFCTPLGGGNRVRLPKCVVCTVRRAFPNPVCSAGCDYWVQCERAGHYTGFRTADESRAVREGRYLNVDVR